MSYDPPIPDDIDLKTLAKQLVIELREARDAHREVLRRLEKCELDLWSLASRADDFVQACGVAARRHT